MAWMRRDWEKQIRSIATDTRNVVWTDHARQQIQQRDITVSVAHDVLLHGVIRREPEIDIRTGDTVCRMERFVAGKLIRICVALKSAEPDLAIVVTAMLAGD